MPEFKLVILVNPKEGRDDEFNDWYDNVHIPEVLTLRSFKAGQRFTVGGKLIGAAAPKRYAVIYDLESDTIEAAIQDAANGHADFPIPDFLEAQDVPEGSHMYPFTPLGPVTHAVDDADAGSCDLSDFKLLVLVDPRDGRDDEFNDWYSNVHVPEVLTLPSFRSAQRFRTGPPLGVIPPPKRYGVIYAVRAKSIEDAMAEALEGHARFPIPDFLEEQDVPGGSVMYPLIPLGPLVHEAS